MSVLLPFGNRFYSWNKPATASTNARRTQGRQFGKRDIFEKGAGTLLTTWTESYAEHARRGNYNSPGSMGCLRRVIGTARVALVARLRATGVAQPKEVFSTEPTGSALRRIDITRMLRILNKLG